MKARSPLPCGICRRPWYTRCEDQASFLASGLLGLTQALLATRPSSQPDPSPPPGRPHSASSASLHSERPHRSAWAGSRPEGLHQRSCSISSTDQWSAAAALPASVQRPGEWWAAHLLPTSSGICLSNTEREPRCPGAWKTDREGPGVLQGALQAL